MRRVGYQAQANTDIGAEKAKSIALNHAGVSASQTTELKVERDTDDGVLEYEVEFKAGGMEYEYKIDARTGGVLTYEDRIGLRRQAPPGATGSGRRVFLKRLKAPCPAGRRTGPCRACPRRGSGLRRRPGRRT